MRVIWWGTYDESKPRNRILLRGLREADIEIIECHASVWSGIEDKSQIKGLGKRTYFLLRWLFSYPGLIIRYFRLPKHDAVVIGYLGLVDVLVLWLFARLRGTIIIWDAFLSLYGTVIEDRSVFGRRHPVAVLLFGLEWLACRAAELVVLDTRTHAEYFQNTFHLSSERTEAIFVGVEPEYFPPKSGSSVVPKQPGSSITVLFYGQFIPLHGIETIVRAAELAKDMPIDWLLIGSGQEEARIRDMLDARPVPRLTWIPWVAYGELNDRIHDADISLGIFGDTDKAARVIPNKVFQALAASAPVITRDSPAIRELLQPDMAGVWLVPPADPEALLAAIEDYIDQRSDLVAQNLHAGLRERIQPRAIGHEFAQIISREVEARASKRHQNRRRRNDKPI